MGKRKGEAALFKEAHRILDNQATGMRRTVAEYGEHLNSYEMLGVKGILRTCDRLLKKQSLFDLVRHGRSGKTEEIMRASADMVGIDFYLKMLIQKRIEEKGSGGADTG
ncbi:MAG: hypothetical protein KGH50_00730 [Candidatus Micrarchaeota archaeon]|nr:hypothetical protein [Candidatus Micrarchaeota archaeon]